MSLSVLLKPSRGKFDHCTIEKLIESIWLRRNGSAVVHVELVIRRQSTGALSGVRFLVSGEARGVRDRRDLLVNRHLCEHMYDEGWRIVNDDQSVIAANKFDSLYIGSDRRPLIAGCRVTLVSDFPPQRHKNAYADRISMSEIELTFGETDGNHEYYGVRFMYQIPDGADVRRTRVFAETITTFEKRLYDNKAIAGGLLSRIDVADVIPVPRAYVWVVLPFGAVPVVVSSEQEIFNKQIIGPNPWRMFDSHIKGPRLVICWCLEHLTAVPQWSEKRIMWQHTFPPPAASLTWLGFFAGIIGVLVSLIAMLIS